MSLASGNPSAGVLDGRPASDTRAPGRWSRELRLFSRDRAGVGALVLLAVLAALGVGLGLLEVARQQAAIERFEALDAADRRQAFDGAEDFGGAAYGGFHGIWNPPSSLAFAALGQRDVAPWMRRVRALALEGQIHESDALNPELAVLGRFDYAFVVAFLLPLVTILLLHGLVSTERERGRLALLTATSGSGAGLWIVRAGVRVALMAVAVLLPFWLGALLSGAGLAGTGLVTLVVLAQLLFWSLLALAFAARAWSTPVIASSLSGLWLLLTLIVPLGGSLLIDRLVPGVEGAEISLVQREAVNDAWDLPKAATMERFFESHPQWQDTAPVTRPFHWKWYFAFQQVGDETAAPLSAAYREAIAERDRLAGVVGLLSPAVAAQRALQRIAATDTQAQLAFDARVRAFHERIRHFYYPLLFDEVPFDRDRLEGAPRFQP